MNKTYLQFLLRHVNLMFHHFCKTSTPRLAVGLCEDQSRLNRFCCETLFFSYQPQFDFNFILKSKFWKTIPCFVFQKQKFDEKKFLLSLVKIILIQIFRKMLEYGKLKLNWSHRDHPPALSIRNSANVGVKFYVVFSRAYLFISE